MHSKRFFVYSFFLILSFTSFFLPAKNLGIAFIHGTNDHRQDANTEYWKKPFIETIATALPSAQNYVVISCDFSQYMWHEDAAGCVANQLLDFIKDKQITQLIVYTHSNGGNVIRWILSNPSYDSRYFAVSKTINQVIAIAPSSAGTPLADEIFEGNRIESGLGWLLGYKNDSIKQQRVADMKMFNAEMLLGTSGRPSLPVVFRTIIGTDVIASPFNKNSYCNGYMVSAGLKLTKAYLADCSDGVIECSSQAAAGTVWFYDWQKTDKSFPLNHNQSRHACFNLEHILREDLLLQGVQG